MSTPASTHPIDLTSVHLCIHRGSSRFGIPMENMVEIRDFTNFHKLPLQEEFLLGCVSFRNRIIPIFDPSLLLESASSPVLFPAKVAVVGLGGDGIFGVLLDRVGDVIEVFPNHLTPVQARLPSAFLYEFNDGHGDPMRILNLQGVVTSLDLDIPERGTINSL